MVFTVFTDLCGHDHNPIFDHFYHPPNKPVTQQPLIPSPSPNFRRPQIYFLFPKVCLSQIFHIRRLHVLLCLASFTDRVFEVHSCCSKYHYFIPISCQIIYHMDVLHFLYPFTSWWTLELFPLFGYCIAIPNSQPKNLCANMRLYFSLAEITGSYGYSTMNLWRKCQTIFQSGCAILLLISSVWGIHFLHIFANTH